MAGLPNSLAKAAAPNGASSIICRGVATCEGAPTCSVADSQGASNPGMRKSLTANPTNPHLGFEPTPTAPSSRISPPVPVAAPAWGEMTVG
ncbi:hypothetical protein GGI14_006091, partial [Coemansia sp. S680]